MAKASETAACVLEKFKKSEDVAFYRRQMQGPKLQHRALLDTLQLSDKGAQLELLELNTQTALLLSLSVSREDSVRIVVDELRPLKSRYRVPDVVVEEPQCEQLRADGPSSQDSLVLSWSSGRHSVCVWSFPFRLDILCQQEVAVTFNANGKLWLEAVGDPPGLQVMTQVVCGERLSRSLWISKPVVPPAWGQMLLSTASAMSLALLCTPTPCVSETPGMASRTACTTWTPSPTPSTAAWACTARCRCCWPTMPSARWASSGSTPRKRL